MEYVGCNTCGRLRHSAV